jgi:hypothetical protein
MGHVRRTASRFQPLIVTIAYKVTSAASNGVGLIA